MQTLTELRNRAFVKQALAILSRHMRAGERITRRQLVEKALASRPPSYFINQDQVSIVLSAIDRMPDFKPASERHAMWLEIRNRVRNLMEGPRKLRRHEAVSFVLNFTQPSRYFISHKTADRLIGSAVRTNRYAVAAN